MFDEEVVRPLNPYRDLAEALDHQFEVINYPPKSVEQENGFVSFEALVEREFELLERIEYDELHDMD
jgi:hypothetical protein